MAQSPGFNIRKSAAEDAEAIAALKREVEDSTYRDYGSEAEHQASLNRFCSADYIRSLQDVGTVLVAEHDREMLGMLACQRIGPAINISGVYLRERCRGIGTELLLAALPSRGEAAEVRLEVFERNDAARRFFQHRGFRETGQSRASESYAGERLIEMAGSVESIRSATTALNTRRHSG